MRSGHQPHAQRHEDHRGCEQRAALAAQCSRPVRRSFPRNKLHIDFEGDGAFLRQLPQVREAEIDEDSAVISLAEGADAQKVLESCVPRLRVRRFEIAAPSLEEIFIEKVGAETLAAEVVR